MLIYAPLQRGEIKISQETGGNAIQKSVVIDGDVGRPTPLISGRHTYKLHHYGFTASRGLPLPSLLFTRIPKTLLIGTTKHEMVSLPQVHVINARNVVYSFQIPYSFIGPRPATRPTCTWCLLQALYCCGMQ